MKANKEYDERIVANIEILQEVLSVAPVHPNPNPSNNFKLLTVSLPDLKINRSNDFQKFLQKFERMLYTHNQIPCEKFLHLRQHLSGNPRTIINLVDAQDQKYNVANRILIEAFTIQILSFI